MFSFNATRPSTLTIASARINRPKRSTGQYLYDVFLGGSCGPTVWRSEYVIPSLQKRDITYYDPQRAEWSLQLIQEEEFAKKKSRLCLFVLDPATINATSYLEIAYLAARRPSDLVVVFLGGGIYFQQHDMMPERAKAMHALAMILRCHSIPIFSSINDALSLIETSIIGQKSLLEALNSSSQFLPYLRIKVKRLISFRTAITAKMNNKQQNPRNMVRSLLPRVLLFEALLLLALILCFFFVNTLSNHFIQPSSTSDESIWWLCWFIVVPFAVLNYLVGISFLCIGRYKAYWKKNGINGGKAVIVDPESGMEKFVVIEVPPALASPLRVLPPRELMLRPSETPKSAITNNRTLKNRQEVPIERHLNKCIDNQTYFHHSSSSLNNAKGTSSGEDNNVIPPKTADHNHNAHVDAASPPDEYQQHPTLFVYASKEELGQIANIVFPKLLSVYGPDVATKELQLLENGLGRSKEETFISSILNLEQSLESNRILCIIPAPTDTTKDTFLLTFIEVAYLIGRFDAGSNISVLLPNDTNFVITRDCDHNGTFTSSQHFNAAAPPTTVVESFDHWKSHRIACLYLKQMVNDNGCHLFTGPLESNKINGNLDLVDVVMQLLPICNIRNEEMDQTANSSRAKQANH